MKHGYSHKCEQMSEVDCQIHGKETVNWFVA